MAVQANLVTLPGLIAQGDLSSSQFYFVKMASTAGRVKPVAATTDLAVGVLQNDPTTLEEALVAAGGLSKLVAGTSVGWAEGIAVGWNTTGKAVPLAANTTNDNRPYMGRFHSAWGQTTTVTLNQVISVQLFPGAMRL